MIKKNNIPETVEYLGRRVLKDPFRVFVYNDNGKKLVNSYKEFKEAIASGQWFAEIVKAESKHKTRKPKDGANS